MQSYDITLTDTNVHKLKDLIQTAFTAKFPNNNVNDLICEYRELAIRADSGNGANILYRGDSDVSSTDYAMDYGAGVSDTLRASNPKDQRIFSSVIYVRASAANVRFHVSARP